MQLKPIAVALLSGFVAVACGGGDGDDASGTIDAPGGAIDAMRLPDAPGQSTGLGMPCTGTGQANCPTGFECLTLTGGTGSWCSKLCADQNDPSCNAGYTGPGYGMCLLTVSGGGGNPRRFCTIVCDDPATDPMICPATEDCNGTCPSPLACTGEITSGTMVVGHTCR